MTFLGSAVSSTTRSLPPRPSLGIPPRSMQGASSNIPQFSLALRSTLFLRGKGLLKLSLQSLAWVAGKRRGGGMGTQTEMIQKQMAAHSNAAAKTPSASPWQAGRLQTVNRTQNWGGELGSYVGKEKSRVFLQDSANQREDTTEKEPRDYTIPDKERPPNNTHIPLASTRI